ncbi:MAG: hypothetical protein JW709_10065 [Sedimentisphaerales bacterium]|nr:hypothetical protein [Sedimentisphaerales bacterium]
MTLLTLWCFDAPPIVNDYTVADLRTAPSQYDATYELLCRLSEVDKIDWPKEKQGLSAEQLNELMNIPGIAESISKMQQREPDAEELLAQAFNILMGNGDSDYAQRLILAETHAKDICHYWEGTALQRSIIQKINAYEQVSDLTEPDLWASLQYLGPLRDVVKAHLLYAHLACAHGEQHALAVFLLDIDGVARKLSHNSRPLIAKLACYGVLQMNIRTANLILNHPTTGPETIALLAEHFQPIDKEITSLSNSFVYEYLILDRIYEENMPFGDDFIDVAQKLSFCKPNSALRVYRNYWNQQIDRATDGENIYGAKQEILSVWPNIYPDFGSVSINKDKNLPKFYTKYNPLGSFYIRIFMMDIQKVFLLRTNVHVRDDLLQIVLKARQGMPYDLTARAYGDKYIYDAEKHILYSPGADEESFTDDDIKLIINPEVIDIK